MAFCRIDMTAHRIVILPTDDLAGWVGPSSLAKDRGSVVAVVSFERSAGLHGVSLPPRGRDGLLRFRPGGALGH